MTMRHTRALTSVLFCIVLSDLGNAAQFEYEIWAGAARNDNIARTETAEIEETIALAGLRLDLQHESRRVLLNLVSDLEYRNYSGDTFDNETVGALNAELDLQLAEDVLSWVFENRFGNLQSNPFQPNTAGNRENFNVFSTGPDLRMRLGFSTAIEASARYRSNRFEESNINSKTRSGRIALVRGLSPNRSISLNATADRNEFDDADFNDNYDRLGAFVGFDSEISKGILSVSAGINEIKPEFEEPVSGPLYNVYWVRDILASTRFSLGYFQGLTYAGATSLTAPRSEDSEPEREFSETEQTSAVSDAFENQSISAAIEYQRRGNSFFISAAYNEDDYINSNVLDLTRSELRAGVERGIGSAWRIRFGGMLQKTEFVESDRQDDDVTGQVGLSRQFSRALSLNLDYFYTDRSSNVDGSSYVENVLYLTISFAK